MNGSQSAPGPAFNGVALGLLCALIWGCHAVVSRLGMLTAMDAADITALRVGVAAALLFPVLARAGLANAGGIGWGRAMALSLCAGATYNLMTVGGLAFAPTAHVAVLTPGLIPVMAQLVGWALLGARPQGARALGAGVALAGVACVAGDGLLLAGPQAWIGDLMFVGAALMWALYATASQAWKVPALTGAAAVNVGSLALLPAYLWHRADGLPAAALGDVALQAVYQGVLLAIVTTVLFTRVVALLGGARAALFTALVPPLGALLAWAVLGEALSVLQIVGAALVTGGLVLGLRGAR